jgi:peptidoglycan/xylan/chitin deacetylase (PgdA/CDA1 family)
MVPAPVGTIFNIGSLSSAAKNFQKIMTNKMSIVLATLLLATLPAIGCRRYAPTTDQQEQQAGANTTSPSPAPVQAPPAAQARTPSASTAVSKTLYLTFDADMTPGMLRREKDHKVALWYSPGLVDYLLENRIHATVFSTGMFAEDYPELITRLASSGLISIQNHTYDHAAFSAPCYGLATVVTDQEKNEEMSKATDAIRRLTGQTPTYLRHPGLCHKPHDVDLAEQMGLKISDVGTISGDAFAKNPQLVADTILRGAAHNPIIILHLGGPNAPATEVAIKMVVPKLQAAGYTFAQMQ